jgi:hypothetical protein
VGGVFQPVRTLDSCLSPVFASDYPDATEINALTAQLTAAIPKFTFFRLRHLLIDFLVVGTRPTEAVSAASVISRIATRTKAGDFNCEPSAESLDRAPTPRRREAAHALKKLNIGRLRNQVAHGRGGYLSREDVEPCFEEEIGVLYRVKHVLGVGDWMEHQANAVYEDE